jgi:hypothetical protein
MIAQLRQAVTRTLWLSQRSLVKGSSIRVRLACTLICPIEDIGRGLPRQGNVTPLNFRPLSCCHKGCSPRRLPCELAYFWLRREGSHRLQYVDMADNPLPRKPSTFPEAVARKRRFLWSAGAVVVLLALGVLQWQK